MWRQHFARSHFPRTGEVDFTRTPRFALGEARPSDLALALDQRIRHILVDEFQDTARPVPLCWRD